jgi:membrane protease YdiL (CAAX protease family)
MPSTSKRDDPRYDTRRLIAFFLGLVAFYAGVVAVTSPGPGDITKVALGLMFAPAVGALAAVLFAHGRIRFGRPTKHLFLAFVPPAIIMATTWAASTVTDVDVNPGKVATLLALAPVFALSGAVSALGEEIGWRGFFWPLLRRRTSFWIASMVLVPVWWVYHLPGVLLWGYGFIGGLVPFTLAIIGVTLFVGVLTDRSRSIWPSVLVHGAWNGMVAKAYVTSASSGAIPTCTDAGCPDFAGEAYVFTGPQTLLGEFGWIAGITMLLIGLIAGWWHVRHPIDQGAVPGAARGVTQTATG